MKHWHRCGRWVRRGLYCPFEKVEEHEDDPDLQDAIEFQRRPRMGREHARKITPGVPAAGASRQTAPASVGRHAFPLEATREGWAPGVKVPTRILEAFGIPIPRHQGFGKVTLPQAAAQALKVMSDAVGNPSAITARSEVEALKDKYRATAEQASATAAGEAASEVFGKIGSVVTTGALTTLPLLREALAKSRVYRGLREARLKRPSPVANPHARPKYGPAVKYGKAPHLTKIVKVGGGLKSPTPKAGAGYLTQFDWNAKLKAMLPGARRSFAPGDVD